MVSVTIDFSGVTRCYDNFNKSFRRGEGEGGDDLRRHFRRPHVMPCETTWFFIFKKCHSLA